MSREHRQQATHRAGVLRAQQAAAEHAALEASHPVPGAAPLTAAGATVLRALCIAVARFRQSPTRWSPSTSSFLTRDPRW